MLLTISTTHSPATDLGYLLHKHPAKMQSFDLSFGSASVFYPAADASRCECALLLDVDSVGLVRGAGRTLDQYVSDRPYVASSLMSVAIGQIFGTAMTGRCDSRPELAASAIPLEAAIPAIACAARESGATLLAELFSPLGYEVESADLGAGISSLRLRGNVQLSALLSHLYVLIPVLDDDKHYWVGDDEVAKLLRHGEGWLASHPKRELIARRYLKHRRALANEAIAQLRRADGDAAEDAEAADPREEAGEAALTLHEQRHAAVIAEVRTAAAKSVIDLGCGEGRLLRVLAKEQGIERLAGMDVSHRSLEIAADRLRLDTLPAARRERLSLFQGSLMYRDERLAGYDAGVLCEVIEHLDPPRLRAMERVVFEFARPGVVVITTPNADYNVLFPSLTAGAFRHRDHRFEWTRSQFGTWAGDVARRHGYRLRRADVGPAGAGPDGNPLGGPTQMGVFTRGD